MGISPQQAIKRSGDIVAYIAASINKQAKPSLARIISSPNVAVMSRRVGIHLWRLGCVTFPTCPLDSWNTSWWNTEVAAKPTFLGHQVYRHLKSIGEYDLPRG